MKYWNKYTYLHSSEKRGLCLTKCSCETFQNLPYFWNAIKYSTKRKTMWVFTFHIPKYGKRSVFLKHFIKHKHLISEECLSTLFAVCAFSPFKYPTVDWMLTPFITAYPSEVTSKNALYQVRCSLTPAPAAVLPVSVALSLPMKLKHADFDIVCLLCAISVHTTSFLALVWYLTVSSSSWASKI